MKIKFFLLCVIGLMMLGGCSKGEQEEEFLNASHNQFFYEGTEDVNRIAVDENGFLYTVKCIVPDQNLMTEERNLYQEICVYDLEGNCIQQENVFLGNASAQALWIQKDILYCVTGKNLADVSVATLYAVDTSSWEVTEISSLKGFSRINTMAYCDDYLYFLGQYDQRQSVSYVLHPDVLAYNYAGEQIGRITITEEESYVEVMNIDFPISMYVTPEDTLMIYHYTEENGFGFLEFNSKKLSFSDASWKNTNVSLQKLGGCGNGYLFLKDTYLYYGTVDGMEAQVASERIDIWIPAVYQKGFAFLIDYAKEGKVERICIADIVKENKIIHMLMHDDIMDLPYGCGYRMEKEVLSSEEFALKVLAQDSDFDVYVLSSRDKASYNLKEKGAFYPLNEVPYVQEYLDACFPYVKELAVNKEGEVWMLPIGLAIPGLVYNKEYCAQQGIDFEKMNFSDFFDFTAEIKQGEQAEQLAVSALVMKEELFGQYMKVEDSFDTVRFRSHMEQFKEIYQGRTQTWEIAIDAFDEILDGKRPEFYYMYEVYQYMLSLLAKAVGNSSDIGITAVPKLEEGIGNVGTVTFLSVNPQADNLKSTLDYISSFAQYMLTKQDSFLLADELTYTDTPFVRKWYELYAGGTIRFNMDLEVYEEIFLKYLADEMDLETAVTEMERRRKIYMEE